MRDHLGRGDGTELRAEFQRIVACVSEEEAGREQVAGAGRVEYFLDILRGCSQHGLALHDVTAFGTGGDDGKVAIVLHGLDCGLECIDLIQRHQFVFVAEQNVDLVGH